MVAQDAGRSEHGGDASEEDRQRLEEQCRMLRSKLHDAKKRRGETQRMVKNAVSEKLPACLERRNQAECDRAAALDQYRLVVSRRFLASSRLEMARKWNVTNDCFYIWHFGPFGTINCLRLGSEVPAMPSTGITDTDDAIVKTTNETANSGIDSIVGSLWGTDFSTKAGNSTSNVISNESTQKGGELNGETGFKVPWVEINSALGFVALLLSTLEQKPHSGIRFANEIVPMGSSSKIGLRSGSSVVTFYNLYSDDSFQFFGKRNFNIALNGLVSCLFDAAVKVQKLDRTIALPHPVEMKARNEYTIGGLSVAYGNDGERWTRAMKYLLTDMKWILAFTTKHVDM